MQKVSHRGTKKLSPNDTDIKQQYRNPDSLASDPAMALSATIGSRKGGRQIHHGTLSKGTPCIGDCLGQAMFLAVYTTSYPVILWGFITRVIPTLLDSLPQAIGVTIRLGSWGETGFHFFKTNAPMCYL